MRNIDLDNIIGERIDSRATSGSFSTAFGSNSKYTLLVEWKRNSVDIANNKSNITVTAYLVSGGSSYTIISSATKNGSFTINGTSYSFTFGAALSGNQKKQIATKTVDIYHNSDGTKSFSISCSASVAITFSSGYVGTVNASGTATLDSIPRTSSFSLSTTSATLGSTAVTINISRASSSFTHKVYCQFGSTKVTISTSAATSVSYTPALSLASVIPNATSGTATIIVETYNGSSHVGSTSKTLTLTVPSSVKPTLSGITATLVANGIDSSLGYVSGKSKCTLAISGAAGSYGSTIKSYKVTGAGGSWTNTTSSFTTGVVYTTGSVTFTATVVDSRGRTSDAKTVTINVSDYTQPSITEYSVIRCNSSGNADDNGTYLKVYAKYSYSSVGGKNTITSKAEYRDTNSTSFTNIGSVSSGSTVVAGGGKISTEKSYVVKFTITDKITNTSKSLTIPTAFLTMDLKKGGKGVAFGKISNYDEFEVDMSTRFYKGAKVYSLASNADVALDFLESRNQARIRVGGGSPGANNGFEIQSPGDTVDFKVRSGGATVTKGLVPMATKTYNLGSDTERWSNLFLSQTARIDVSDGEKHYGFYDSSGKAVYTYGQNTGRIGMYDGINGRGVFFYNYNSGTPFVIMQNHFVPQSNNSFNCGNSTYRWAGVYGVAAYNTSDISYKENIKYLNKNNKREDLKEEVSQEDIYNFYKTNLNIATYNYKENNNQEYGFIAQDLASDKVGKTIIIEDENGYMYSVGSYISSVASALQYEINIRDKELKQQSIINAELLKSINELKDRLSKLENNTLVNEAI